MRQRPFGPTGLLVPIVGQGTWNMERDPRAECIAAIRRGIDLGMTHIDTAELYGSGRVEELVGEAIAGRRDEVYLVSKVLPHNASHDGTIAACERSLRRLRTDRLDLYLLHWPGDHPLDDTFAAFAKLQADGKIRHFGVSNFSVGEMEQALAITGEGGLACNQVLYHLEERAIEHTVLPFCEAHQIAVVAYSPFGSGSFPSPRSGGGRILGEIADAHGATPHQVALAFLLRKPAVFAIPKASSVAHVEQNAVAAELELERDEIERIDAAFPVGADTGELPTL
jgi:diketogulonate reductase-like aldo/keto reductase